MEQIKIRDFMYELNDEAQLPDNIIDDAIRKLGTNGISFRREVKALVDSEMLPMLDIDSRLHKPISDFFKDLQAARGVHKSSRSNGKSELTDGPGFGAVQGTSVSAFTGKGVRTIIGRANLDGGLDAPSSSSSGATNRYTNSDQKRRHQRPQKSVARDREAEVEAEVSEKKRRTNACMFCGKPPEMPVSLKCNHIACTLCLHDAAVSATKEKKGLPLKCRTCREEIGTDILQTRLYPHEFQAYNEALLENFITTDEKMVKCIKCKNVFAVVPQDNLETPRKIIERDGFGNPLKKEAWKHYKQNRLRCTQCGTVFCGKCKQEPYHMGYTCEGYVEYKNSKQCRFCQEQITEENKHKMPSSSTLQTMGSSQLVKFLQDHGMSRMKIRGLKEKHHIIKESQKIHRIFTDIFGDICNKPECSEKRQLACTSRLPCGHPCQGVRGESKHLPCMHCTKNIDPTDFCNICYVEGLKDAPCIQSNGKCKHIFHLKCVVDRISAGYNGARINFKFITCPLCNNEIEHPALTKAMKPWLRLRKSIERKAIARLLYEKRGADPKIKSKFGGSQKEFAMHEYLFYKCHKCKQPYFAGNYACQAADDGKFDPEELLCAGCQPSQDVSNCPQHGTEWIAFKCRFCCNTAQWYYNAYVTSYTIFKMHMYGYTHMQLMGIFRKIPICLPGSAGIRHISVESAINHAFGSH
ncbi:hypothetical protein AAMO2058_000026100 [Amorphochlora amoebiformis]